MEDQGVRKFVVHKVAGSTTKVLKLWIFTPDLTVSSSAMGYPEPARFMKVLWQHSEIPAENDARLNAGALSEGELKLQGDEADVLEAFLKRRGELVPEGARRFQEWNVGLLARFSIEDLEPS